MNPRDKSPVKTLSPRRPLGQDLGIQMSPLHKLLVRLARGELTPGLSLVSPKVFFSILSPMEFRFLAGVLRSGFLRPVTIADHRKQYLPIRSPIPIFLKPSFYHVDLFIVILQSVFLDIYSVQCLNFIF